MLSEGGTTPSAPGWRVVMTAFASPLVASVALGATGYYCWLQRRLLREERDALARERRELQATRTATTAQPPQHLSASPTGGSGQLRSWKSHLAGLDKMISELLLEARLLASELNKGGDPAAIITDPLQPTSTAERQISGTPRRPTLTRQSSNLIDERQPGTAGLAAIREQLGAFEPGSMDTRVVAVCGMSCSGKSTVSSVLRAHAARQGAYVPVICLDDSYHEWMNEDPFRGQRTSLRPAGVAPGGREWKNWESAACVDWQQFLDKLQAKVEVHKGYTPFIIIEGFLVLEAPSVVAMCNDVVSIEVSAEVAWQRRLARALAMAAGERDASGMDNYERLPVYAVEDDFEAIRVAGAEAVRKSGGASAVYPAAPDAVAEADLRGAAGEYDWLRLYFEEVIWPEAEAVRRRVHELGTRAASSSGHVDVHVVDGDQSPKDVERETRRVISRAFVQGRSVRRESTGAELR